LPYGCQALNGIQDPKQVHDDRKEHLEEHAAGAPRHDKRGLLFHGARPPERGLEFRLHGGNDLTGVSHADLEISPPVEPSPSAQVQRSGLNVLREILVHDFVVSPSVLLEQPREVLPGAFGPAPGVCLDEVVEAGGALIAWNFQIAPVGQRPCPISILLLPWRPVDNLL
jgi:hypothetical protein